MQKCAIFLIFPSTFVVSAHWRHLIETIPIRGLSACFQRIKIYMKLDTHDHIQKSVWISRLYIKIPLGPSS